MTTIYLKGYGDRLPPGGDGSPFTYTVDVEFLPRRNDTFELMIDKTPKTYLVREVKHTLTSADNVMVTVNLGFALEDLR